MCPNQAANPEWKMQVRTNQNNAWQAFHLLRLQPAGFEHCNTGKSPRGIPWNDS